MPKKKPLKLDSEQKKKALQEKIRELFREIIGGLSLAEITLPEKLGGQDRIDFARFCHQTYHSPFFKQVLEALYYPQIMHIGMKSVDIDEVSFNRATANGIMLVGEMFQKWANIFDEDYSSDAKAKNFDRTKTFESINE